MNDRTQRVLALVGLVGLGGACGNEVAAPEATPTNEEGETKAPAVGAGDTKAGDAPVEPPPTGHAVAKTGALLFFSSTGDVGFPRPPAERQSRRTVVRGAHDEVANCMRNYVDFSFFSGCPGGRRRTRNSFGTRGVRE